VTAPLQAKASSSPPSALTPVRRVLQRKRACYGPDGPSGHYDTCGRKKLQRRAENLDPPSVSEVPAIVHEVIGSPGQPLDSRARAFMEPRFGHDFGRVRVHYDEKSAMSAQAVDASAYTVGHHVVFNAGRYRPATTDGLGLLAHELTHVVQQNQSLAREEGLTISEHDDPAEREADAVVETIVDHRPALISAQHSKSIVQRQVPAAPTYRLTPTSSQIPVAAPGLTAVKIWLNTFIPMATAGPYAGDNRGFSADIQASHRTHQEIEFETASLHKTIDWKHVGTSHIMVPSALLPVRVPPMFLPPLIPVASDTASSDTLTNGPLLPSGDEVLVHFEVDSANPLAPGAPAINLEADFHINMGLRTCRLVGNHDGFPAYEAYITANGGAGTAVYRYDPRTEGEGPRALFPPMDKYVSTKAVAF
jgi:hypothetical protein